MCNVTKACKAFKKKFKVLEEGILYSWTMSSHQKNRCKVPPHVEGCLFFYLGIHHNLVVYECLIHDFAYSLGSINVHIWGLSPLFQDWAHHRPLPWAT